MREVRLWLSAGVVLLTACAGVDTTPASPAAMGDPTTGSPSEWTGVTRHVPSEYPTIQAAVDAADPGDLVLVDRGVYRETVDVATPGVTIRGVDRNEVIVDGEFERANGVQVLFTDGVVVENMTAMNHIVNGFFWNGARGFRGSYLTAINNGDYGIYAFDSGDGLFEHSYASGSPDAAFYVGQCNPCQTVVTDSVGEYSGLGYSGTNASNDIYIVENVFRNNGAGMAPNTLDSELLPPATGVMVAGNLIHDNGYGVFPHKNAQWTTQGNGIVAAGIEDSVIRT
ncbi:MAG: right-handed parallel beta-helix repeat-containing protein [Actinobacteria bacterium]|nr:right-handed parallel beta-helix repeat-containing protein [Actinomycetota bacterium]